MSERARERERERKSAPPGPAAGATSSSSAAAASSGTAALRNRISPRFPVVAVWWRGGHVAERTALGCLALARQLVAQIAGAGAYRFASIFFATLTQQSRVSGSVLLPSLACQQ